jgi:hypothetical protein
MDIAKLRIPRKVNCSKIKNENKCTSNESCIWNNAKCDQNEHINTNNTLFDNYVRIVHTKSGKYILEMIAKSLHINYEGRNIKNICDDIQEVLHVAMHGNTISTIAKKLKISTFSHDETNTNKLYYIIYKYIFDKLSESNHPDNQIKINSKITLLSSAHASRKFIHEAPIIPGIIDFDKEKVVYKNQYQFKNRIEYMNVIKEILNKYTKEEICDFKKGFEKIKRIGTRSKEGEAYIAYNGDNKLPIYVAIKLMPVKPYNINEVQKYRLFTNYVLNHNSPHFPIIYSTKKCKECKYDDKRHFTNKECITLINELAQGDLKSYLKINHTSYDLICIIGQLIMACLAMEHAGIVHHDMHWGNYLYHIVPEYKGKYMHYSYYDVINNKMRNVYLKNNGVIFIAWDFSDMRPMYRMTDNVTQDLYRILHIYRWAVETGYPKFPKDAYDVCKELINETRISPDISGMLNYFALLLHNKSMSQRIQDIIYIDPETPIDPTNIINIIPYDLPI